MTAINQRMTEVHHRANEKQINDFGYDNLTGYQKIRPVTFDVGIFQPPENSKYVVRLVPNATPRFSRDFTNTGNV